MIRFCLSSALCLAAGVAAANPAMTAEDTTMRAAPSAHARAVQSIPANAQIDLGECREHWCAASWKNLEGWVRVESVAANSEPLVGAAPPPEEDFATARLTPMARSFYDDNRRVDVGRLRRELGYRWLYPTYREGLEALAAAGEGRATT